jgi:hypothetical protein
MARLMAYRPDFSGNMVEDPVKGMWFRRCDVAPYIEEASSASANIARAKPCAECIAGPIESCDRLCCHNTQIIDAFEPRMASPVA